MLNLRDGLKVYVSLMPIDMRKAINGLSAQVAEVLQQSPQSGHVFVFYNKAKDKVKCLYWDRNGFVLHYKRLEKGRFRFLGAVNEGTLEISEEQLTWLLAGLDFLLMNDFSELNYEHYY